MKQSTGFVLQRQLSLLPFQWSNPDVDEAAALESSYWSEIEMAIMRKEEDERTAQIERLQEVNFRFFQFACYVLAIMKELLSQKSKISEECC